MISTSKVTLVGKHCSTEACKPFVASLLHKGRFKWFAANQPLNCAVEIMLW